MDKYHQLADLLLEVEMVMRQEQLWDIPEPSPQAFTSVEPFCIDTMQFDQWVKFVMLERYKNLIATQQDLPTHSNIAPVVEMYFQQQQSHVITRVVKAFVQLDEFINAQSHKN